MDPGPTCSMATISYYLRIPFENLIFSETFKITGLESKPYAVREWNAPLFGEEPEEPNCFVQIGWPGLRNFEPIFKDTE